MEDVAGSGQAAGPWAAPDPGRAAPAAAPGAPARPAAPQPAAPWPQQPPYGAPWPQQPPYGAPWPQQPPYGAPWPPGATPWLPAGPPDPTARRRRMWLQLGAVGAVVALLVGGVVLVQSRDDRAREAAEAQVRARLPALQAFVEAERGLAFLEPVDVEVLGDEAFVEALFEPTGGAGPAGDADATLQALGLLEDGESVDDGADTVVGFYDPRTDRLAVRGSSYDAYVELTVVHELVHALQDQHFGLTRVLLEKADDESYLGFSSLVEGDATRVETAWYDAQSRAWQAGYDAEEQRRFGAYEVVASDVLFAFPYIAGPDLVQSLLDTGGQPALDAAFATPPTTSEQVLHPGAAAPRELPTPEVDGEIVDEGVLGEIGLGLLLGADLFDPDAPQVGWNGDRYATYDGDDGPCTVADVVTDTERDLVELAVGLKEAGVATTDGASGALRITVCAP